VYDYCNVDVTSTTKFVATHTTNDGPRGVDSRDRRKFWPAGQDTSSIGLHKLPRGGAYDALCIHPDRGLDDGGARIVAAPYCGDLALHLSWRHGLTWLAGAIPRTSVRGWGVGRLGQGANTLAGAPLVPPNQHVEIELAPAADRSTVSVKYAVTATGIRSGRWQVFLEQGLAYAFQYAQFLAVPFSMTGMTSLQLGWLAEAVGASNMLVTAARLNQFTLLPDKFDAAVRDVWAGIFRRLRSFDPAFDGSAEQQVPNGPSDKPNLEDL
jgi:hypothetical protein